MIDAWRYQIENGGQVLFPEDNFTGPDNDTAPIPPRFVWGDFEAISYCWQSETRDKVVLVNGRTVRVTTNLEALLLELQYLPEALSGMGFWIDGLCINQGDISEKSHQVNLMKRIYSESFSTIIWLGPSRAGDNQAIDFIDETFRGCCVNTIEDDETHWIQFNRMSYPIKAAWWRQVLDLWSRTYFKRMWIIQELALNKALSMFMCGSRRFSRTRLRGACSWAQENAGEISRALDTVPLTHDYIWRTAYDIHSLITLPGFGMTVERVFDLARKANVTNPADKVYGMLGLFPEDMAAQIQPDYSKSRDEVFWELAQLMLARCKRLDEVLTRCTFTEGAVLPSWVPDWTNAHQRKHLRRFRECTAGSAEPPIWSLSGCNTKLNARGVLVDCIEHFSSSSSRLLPYRTVELLRSCSRLGNRQPTGGLPSPPSSPNLERHADSHSRHPQTLQQTSFGRYKDQNGLAQALERTLLHNHPERCSEGNLTDLNWIQWDQLRDLSSHTHIFETSSRTAHQWRFFDQFRHTNASFPIFDYTLKDFFSVAEHPSEDFIMPVENPDRRILDRSGRHRLQPIPLKYHKTEFFYNEHHASNLRRAAVALEHRRLIITQTGHLGLAPEEIKKGDIVAVLLGCNHPVVLRAHGDGFKYIGECYIDGLMDGEVVEAASRGEYQMENILIL